MTLRGWGAYLFRHLDRFVNHRGLKTFIAVGEIVGFAALIVSTTTAAVHHFADGDKQTADPPSISVSPPPSTPPPQTTPPPDGPSNTASTLASRCWTSARVPVDCRESHRFEEMPQTLACTQATVTNFLGGLANLDVLIARPATISGHGCVLDAGHNTSGSALDVLRKGSSASWRRCFDRAVAENLPCSAIHTGEYFATGSTRRATDSECLIAATAYMDQIPGNLVEDLAVHALDVKSGGTPDSARCIINARGNHRLVDSVRNLGSRPVPLATG